MRRFVSVVVLLALLLGSGVPALFGSVATVETEDVCDDTPAESDCCNPADGCACCLHLLQALHAAPDPTPRPGDADSLEPVSIVADPTLLPDDVLHVPRPPTTRLS